MPKHNCPICKVEIPEERIEILRGLRYTEDQFYCTKHALNKTIKAVYSGEHGTSELILCDRVYNDSVRSKFYDVEEAHSTDELPDIETEEESSEE